MKSSAKGSNGATEPARPSQVSGISERKLRANRENAKKSTGPRTDRGKRFSCRNALKHGLCAEKLLPESYWPGDDSDAFRKHFGSLCRTYQPVDVLEVLEVHRIAVCYFRRIRAWYSETAAIRTAQTKFRFGTLFSSKTDIMHSEQVAAFHLLEGARKEIEAGNGMPKELEEELFAAYAPFRELWPRLKRNAQIQAKECHLPLELAIVELGIDYLVRKSQSDHDAYIDLGLSREGLPTSDFLDRLLRYEAANDRALSRALDRLDRLQQRPYRPGGPVVPAIRPHMTQ